MNNKKIVGYVRVSTIEQKKKGFGIDIQIREIKRFAKDNNLKIDQIFKDKAVSGTEESRKDLDLLMNYCQKDQIKAVIFPSTDRTARTVRLSENLYYELVKHNVRLYFTDMPFYDPGNHNDVMNRQIKEVIAENNRNTIVYRLKKGREERIRKGKPAGGTVPYGYKRKNKRLMIYPKEAKIVNMIYLQVNLSKKYSEIADNLNKKNFHRRNNKPWIGRQVSAIVNKKALYQQGIIRYGKVKGQNKKLIIVTKWALKE